MVIIGMHVFIFGGRDNTQRVNDIHVLDVDKMTWLATPLFNADAECPVPRSFHNCSVVDGNIVLFGGLGRDNKHLSDVWLLNPSSYLSSVTSDSKETSASPVWSRPKVDGTIAPRGFYSAITKGNTMFVSTSFDVLYLKYSNETKGLWRFIELQHHDARMHTILQRSVHFYFLCINLNLEVDCIVYLILKSIHNNSLCRFCHFNRSRCTMCLRYSQFPL